MFWGVIAILVAGIMLLSWEVANILITDEIKDHVSLLYTAVAEAGVVVSRLSCVLSINAMSLWQNCHTCFSWHSMMENDVCNKCCCVACSDVMLSGNVQACDAFWWLRLHQTLREQEVNNPRYQPISSLEYIVAISPKEKINPFWADVFTRFYQVMSTKRGLLYDIPHSVLNGQRKGFCWHLIILTKALVMIVVFK